MSLSHLASPVGDLRRRIAIERDEDWHNWKTIAGLRRQIWWRKHLTQGEVAKIRDLSEANVPGHS
eukprot:6206426-Amphidinium_carterae.1